MYSVSDKYQLAARAAVRTERLQGSITLTDGTVLRITPADLMSGSVTIDNQCVNGEELQFGCVYLGQAAFQLKTDISRYKLYDARVVLTYGLQLADGSWEDVPLGIYTVGEAERSSMSVSVKAYDNILMLDKSFAVDALRGTAYTMLVDICTRCGLELAQTADDLAMMPNTTQTFTLDPVEDGLDTYRDCVGTIAELLGCFATVDREGRLCLRQLHTKPDATLGRSDRQEATVADYLCSYVALEIEAGEHSYYATNGGTGGLTMTMTDNPFFAGGTDERNQPMANALMELLGQIRYTPATITMPGDPALECGDMITLLEPGGEAGAEVNTLITHTVWKFRAAQTLKSVGKNPYLASAMTATEKALRTTQRSAQKDSSTFYIYATKNDTALHIGQQETDICLLEYATVDNTRINFVLTSNHVLSLDGSVVVRVYVDETLYQTYTDYEARGPNVLTIDFTLDVRGNARYALRVTMQSQLFVSDRRKDAADHATLWNYADAIVWSMASAQGQWSGLRALKWDKVKTYNWEDLQHGGQGQKSWEDGLYGNNAIDPSQISYTRVQPDETLAEIDIAKDNVTGVLFGRGLAATDVWDGTIRVSDWTERLEMVTGAFTVQPVTDALTAAATAPAAATLADTIGRMTMQGSFAVQAVTDATGMAAERREENIIYMTGTHEGTADIDIGEDYYSVPVRITFDCDAGTRLWVSADSGINWLTWNGDRWNITTEGNTAAELNALGEDAWHALITYGKVRFRWSDGALRTIKLELHGHRTVLALADAEASYDALHVVRDGDFRMITQYTYDSTPGEIDSGRLAVLEIPATEFQSIEEVELK